MHCFEVNFLNILAVGYPDVRSSWQYNIVLHVWMRENHDFALAIQIPDVTGDPTILSLSAILRFSLT